MRDSPRSDSWRVGLLSVLLAGLAGGMGWGIRGQYGHETGAMIAGLLVGLVLAIFHCSETPSLWVGRAVAMMTVAIGIGGSMTYGQTIGLTQDQPLRGNWEALSWGMLGLAIKGGTWIGFAGIFLGASLSGIRYRWWEWLGVMCGLLILKQIGIALLNEPYDPENKILPWLYFSDDWYWEPDSELKPRREVWGGLLVGLIGLLLYFSTLRRDSLAVRMGLWGFLGGALGFPGGQTLQAYHAWNPEKFQSGFWRGLDPYMNWWNMMETTFGFVMGAVLAMGLWIHRRRIAEDIDSHVAWHPAIEWILVIVHCNLLLLAEFGPFRMVSLLYGDGLIMALVPVMAIAAGRWWPFLLVLPVTALPILGKTIRQMVYKELAINEMWGWILYGAIPLSILFSLAIWFGRRSAHQGDSGLFLRLSLFATTWLYFSLNFAFFKFPFPWDTWTSRTPHAIIYAVCTICLTGLCFYPNRNTHLRSY